MGLQTLSTRSLSCSPAGLLPRLTLLPRLDCCLETQRVPELRAIFISFGYIGLTSSPETSCSFSLRTTYSTHNVCSVRLLLLFVPFLVDLEILFSLGPVVGRLGNIVCRGGSAVCTNVVVCDRHARTTWLRYSIK